MVHESVVMTVVVWESWLVDRLVHQSAGLSVNKMVISAVVKLDLLMAELKGLVEASWWVGTTVHWRVEERADLMV